MLADEQIAPYRDALDQLSTVALGQVQNVLSSLSTDNPIAFRDALVEALPDVIAPYGDAAGMVSAEWYMELRGLANVPENFEAVTDISTSREQSEVLARYAVSPLFGQSTSTVLALLSGGVQRLITNVGRDTIFDNIDLDPVRTTWARVPRPGCCTFCGLMASRGAVYNSKESASQVVGRGVAEVTTRGKVGGQGKGVKVRGVQKAGKTFHDHCHCIPVPLHEAQSVLLSPEIRKFDDAYSSGDSTSLTKTLSAMRSELGTK